jgi:hypothetical protein
MVNDSRATETGRLKSGVLQIPRVGWRVERQDHDTHDRAAAHLRRGKALNINRELQLLVAVQSRHVQSSDEMSRLTQELQTINETLWSIEDDIRDCERRQDFTAQFIELARSVYLTNDRRSQLKREINELTGSDLVEEKSYSDYTK